MKIVHSFWSKPLLDHNLKEKKTSPWREPKYFYMSWVLSCLTISRFYNTIELVTDIKGHDLLINKLKLPYNNVKVVLDKLNNYPARLWAIGKIYTYQIQQTPFIHVDGDIFIWKKFEPNIEQSNLIAQNKDTLNGHYKFALSEAKQNKLTIPKAIRDDIAKNPNINAFNAGILGGTNIDFFKKFCFESFKMIDSNFNKYHLSFKSTNYALLYEQLLFSSMTRESQEEVNCLLTNSLFENEESYNMTSFENKYLDSHKYVHLLGNSKTDLMHCNELRNQLLVEFPEYYFRIEKLLFDNQI